MAKHSLASSGLSCCPVVVLIVVIVVPRGGCNGVVLFYREKVQHGAEAFTDIISLIIALSPE
jgi:hypothetical protein